MAKFTIAELVAKFTGDTKGLEDSVYNATYAITSFAKKAVIAAASATAALGGMSLATMKTVGANDDLAKSLGISYKSLVDLRLVADESGTSIERVGASIGIMQKNLIDATAGSGAAYDALNALGISIKDIIALTPDQQFGAIAEKIAEIENPTLRNAVAMDIFGKSGRDIVQIFDNYNEKIAEASRFNEKFNVSLSQVDVEKLGAAEDAVKRVMVAMDGLRNIVAIELSPSIEDLAKSFTDSGAAARGFSMVASAGVKVVSNALKALNTTVNIVAEAYIRAVRNINDVLSQVTFGQTSKGFRANAENATRALEGLNPKEVYGPNKPDVFGGVPSVGGSMPPFDITKKGAKEAKEKVDELDDSIKEILRRQEELKDSAADTFSEFISSVGRGEDAMQSLRSTALKVIDDIVQNMFRLSFGGSTTGGGIGSTIASGLFNMLGIGSSPSFTLGKTAPPRKPFANGGVISGSQLFPIGANLGEMGEKGPEAIMPLVRGSGGKLGVAAHGGGGKSVTVNNNFSLGVQQTVRAEIARMLPDITRASVGAVQDSQQRNILRSV